MTRLATWWTGVRDSLWLIPSIMTGIAIALAFLTISFDRTLLATGRVRDIPFIFGGGAEGARGVLSAIAGGIITVTGVVFSITIIALQQASTQFTPRVLRNFTSDRANQVVLGVFIGTFTYTLLILRTVRASEEQVAAFIPSVSVTIAVLFALVSIAFLIFFIDHSARSIQASTIINRAANDTLALVHRMFPETVGQPAPEPVVPSRIGEPTTIECREGGYLLSVDEDVLFEVAESGGYTIRMEPEIGDYLLPEAVLARVWGPEDLDDQARAAVAKAFVTGHERTPYQDVEHGIIELVDIAVKALSPGINDPTTATQCIDRLGEVLAELGRRDPPRRVRMGAGGRVCFIARRLTFDRAVDVAFDQIRHFGTDNPTIAQRLFATVRDVAARVPPNRRPPLARQASLILSAADAGISDPADLASVRSVAHEALDIARAEEPAQNDGRDGA